MSERSRRVDHLLQEEISAIIRREVQDPRVGFVTITAVEVSKDLRHATVWASVIGDDKERATTMAALGRAMPFVRHHLGSLRMKRVPELHLREDDSAVRGTRVMQLIDRLASDAGDDDAGGDDAGDEDAGSRPEAPPALPNPTSSGHRAADSQADAPLPAAYRRRVDRVALRKARQRRGR